MRSVNDIFLRLRRRLASECQKHSPFAGDLEADESYFGPRRVCGRKGRGAYGKTIVFGLLKRDDQVYTEIVANASKAALQAVIRNKASLASVLHADKWRGYDGLVDLGYERHRRVSHGDDELPWGRTTSMESRASGALPKHAWQSSMGSGERPSLCTSRKPNSALTRERKISTKCYYLYSERSPSEHFCFLSPYFIYE